MQTLRTYSTETEASLVSQMLHQSGIETAVDRLSLYGALSGRGFAVRVSKECVEAACALLVQDDGGPDLDEYVDADDRSYRRCPACGTVMITRQPLTPRQRRLALVSVGIALPFFSRHYCCNKCRYAW